MHARQCHGRLHERVLLDDGQLLHGGEVLGRRFQTFFSNPFLVPLAIRPPRGPPGRNHFTPQARTVYESGANCSCGPWGLSIHRPILCNTNADPAEVEWGKWNVTERGRLPLSPNLLEAGGVRLA